MAAEATASVRSSTGSEPVGAACSQRSASVDENILEGDRRDQKIGGAAPGRPSKSISAAPDTTSLERPLGRAISTGLGRRPPPSPSPFDSSMFRPRRGPAACSVGILWNALRAFSRRRRLSGNAWPVKPRRLAAQQRCRRSLRAAAPRPALQDRARCPLELPPPVNGSRISVELSPDRRAAWTGGTRSGTA